MFTSPVSGFKWLIGVYKQTIISKHEIIRKANNMQDAAQQQLHEWPMFDGYCAVPSSLFKWYCTVRITFDLNCVYNPKRLVEKALNSSFAFMGTLCRNSHHCPLVEQLQIIIEYLRTWDRALGRQITSVEHVGSEHPFFIHQNIQNYST